MPEFLPLALSSLSTPNQEKEEKEEKEEEKERNTSIKNMIVWDTLLFPYTHFLLQEQSDLFYSPNSSSSSSLSPPSPSLLSISPPLYNYSHLVGVGGDGTVSSQHALRRLDEREKGDSKNTEEEQGNRSENKKKKKEKNKNEKKGESKKKIVCYMFTSGSTGVPKGVVLRNHMLSRQVPFLSFFSSHSIFYLFSEPLNFLQVFRQRLEKDQPTAYLYRPLSHMTEFRTFLETFAHGGRGAVVSWSRGTSAAIASVIDDLPLVEVTDFNFLEIKTI